METGLPVCRERLQKWQRVEFWATETRYTAPKLCSDGFWDLQEVKLGALAR